MEHDPFLAVEPAEVYDIPVFDQVITMRIRPLAGSELAVGGEAMIQVVVSRASKEAMD